MKPILFLIASISFTISGNLEPLNRLGSNSTLTAYAAKNCTTIATIEQINGEGFQINRDQKEPLTTASLLCAEEEIESTTSSNIVVRCLTDNESRSILPGITLGITSLCSTAARCEVVNGVEECDRGGNQSTNKKSPEIITPRQTALVNPKPRLAWKPIPDATSYTVRIEEDIEGTIWETTTDQTELIYEGHPPLTAGPTYILVVEADTGEEVATARFSILDDERASAIAAYADTPENINVVPPQIALYKDVLLRAKAIELLENLGKQNTQSSAVYRELGDLYWNIGRTDAAETAYLEAIKLASNHQNLEAEALAQARLGELYQLRQENDKARERIERAQQLYRQAKKFELAQKLDRL